MGFYVGYAVEFASIAAMAWLQWRIGYEAIAWVRGRFAAPLNRVLRICVVVGTSLVLLGLAFSVHEASRLPLSPGSADIFGWLRGCALLWAFASSLAWLSHRALQWLVPRPENIDPGRRALLRTAKTAAIASPFAFMGFGTFIERMDFHVRDVDIPIPDLHPDLENLRLVQLSDIHLSAYLSEKQFARCVDEANALRPHLIFVTGDLISVRGDPLDACLRQISRLRADAGVIGCLGNHEIYAQSERYTTEQGARLGIPFLRAQSRQLRFGNAEMNIAGIDYQKTAWRSHYLKDAPRLLAPGTLNVLLQHNPDVFPTAARQGWDLTLAGHTHGGQVNVEILG